MIKKYLLILVLSLILSLIISIKYENYTYALEIEEIIEDEIKTLDTNRINELEKEIKKDNKNFDLKENIKKIALGDYSALEALDIKRNFLKLKDELLDNLKNNKTLLVSLILIGILSGFIKVLTDSFKDKSISDMANFIIFVVMVGIIMSSMTGIKEIYEEIVVRSTNIIKTSLPVLLTLLVSSGKLKTATFFEPITFFIINLISAFLVKVMKPIIMLLSSIVIINYISNRDVLKELIDGLKDLIKGVLKTIVGFVLGMSYISKLTAGVTDGTLKNVMLNSLGGILPVIGDGASSISKIILSGIELVKNSFGLVLIAGMIITIITPLKKLISIIIVYKLSIILIQQVADEKIKDCLKDISEIMSFIFTTIVMIELIYVLDITMVFG